MSRKELLERYIELQGKLGQLPPSVEVEAYRTEILAIRRRLLEDTCSISVLVADVAKSADMKAGQDPLLVEYSFGEYQAWIQRVCLGCQGHVHSTAGDGAVVAFPGCAEAIHAAQMLQADIGRFNCEVNRLDSPFRLRIGLHVGKIQGELQEVQFSAVIDIAAHVQKLSPVGGIAVSDEVYKELDGTQFVRLAKAIDGHDVYLALDPVGV